MTSQHKHTLWVELHYVVPVAYESEHADRDKAIADAKQDWHGIADALPSHEDLTVDLIEDAWFDVLAAPIDGIYQRRADRVNNPANQGESQ